LQVVVAEHKMVLGLVVQAGLAAEVLLVMQLLHLRQKVRMVLQTLVVEEVEVLTHRLLI
jgi:hypothetical protein